MLKNYILFTTFLLMFIFCENSDKTKSDFRDNSEEAFAKIDKKNNGAFTKEDRRKAFNKSLSSMEKTKNSLKNNVSYNGYGANLTPKKTSPPFGISKSRSVSLSTILLPFNKN